jgi:hypothetical protein
VHHPGPTSLRRLCRWTGVPTANQRRRVNSALMDVFVARADMINLSVVAETSSPAAGRGLRDVLDTAVRRGVVVVAATSNTTTPTHSPLIAQPSRPGRARFIYTRITAGGHTALVSPAICSALVGGQRAIEDPGAVRGGECRPGEGRTPSARVAGMKRIRHAGPESIRMDGRPARRCRLELAAATGGRNGREQQRLRSTITCCAQGGGP